ncbi:MAG TPA: porin family protein [Chitinophagaceae bacterium]|nr:porin family protein [Chitinophagaceae bacterium]
MKIKLFLPLLTALFLSQTMMAQFHIGAKAGANVIKIDGQSFKDEFRYGYHLGGFAEIGLGGKLGIQPEVLFNQYSTTVDSNYNKLYENVFNPNYQRDVKLNYLSIPILLNYKLLGNFLSLQAGPQFGILLDNNRSLLQNGSEAFKSGDFSMVGGAQVKLAAFRFSGRYVIGLNNLNDIDNRDQWKSQGFQLSVGLAL